MRFLNKIDPESRIEDRLLCSFIGTTAALIAAGIAAAGSTASAVIGSKAAGSAADTQAKAGEASVAEQQREFDINQANEAPWIKAGQGTLAQLLAELQPGGKFNSPNPAGTFTAPTLEEAQKTPGYSFAKNEGDLAILRGASAGGGAFNTGTLKSLAGYNGNLASSYYQQAYNNSLSDYLTRFNAANTDQTNLYNRLAGISGTGQNATTSLAQIGTQTAANIGNTLTSIGAAQAAGQVGQANAISNSVSGLTNNLSGYLTLQQLLGKQYGNGNVNPATQLPGGQGYFYPQPQIAL